MSYPTDFSLTLGTYDRSGNSAIVLSNEGVQQFVGSAFPPDYWSSSWFGTIYCSSGLTAILYLALATLRMRQSEGGVPLATGIEERELRAYETSDKLLHGQLRLRLCVQKNRARARDFSSLVEAVRCPHRGRVDRI
jgi:hypothetical protein